MLCIFIRTLVLSGYIVCPNMFIDTWSGRRADPLPLPPTDVWLLSSATDAGLSRTLVTSFLRVSASFFTIIDCVS